ncbi:hypothetical protein ACFSM5_09810 [Lacibacterium aquatile]|uniref:Uncharacterized protein n=1 Tax=Lacibacterium aquatile TaxID=1168082 RepID=A0ABW5DPX6_9PROT
MADDTRGVSRLLVLGAGIILGYAAALYRRPSGFPARLRAEPPEWISDYRKQPDGTIHPDDLVDGTGEDSFPASDPPSFNRFA